MDNRQNVFSKNCGCHHLIMSIEYKKRYISMSIKLHLQIYEWHIFFGIKVFHSVANTQKVFSENYGCHHLMKYVEYKR